MIDRFEFTVSQRAGALQKRRALQIVYESMPQVEVVLFGAERFEDLARTHARFFSSVEQMSVAASTETTAAE